METQNIKTQLQNFHGTAEYHEHVSISQTLLLTDGAHFIREECSAYWLFDIIASYQDNLARLNFQVWIFQREENHCEVRCEDGDDTVIIRQQIEFSDFPLEEIKLWKVDSVILLPSEY